LGDTLNLLMLVKLLKWTKRRIKRDDDDDDDIESRMKIYRLGFSTHLFTRQSTSTRRQRRDLFVFRVKLPPDSTSPTTQK